MYVTDSQSSALRIGAATLGATSLQDAYNKVKLELLQAVNKFTARGKKLPALEAQVRAIGVYALKAPAGSKAKERLTAEHAKGRQDVEQLKASATFISEKTAAALQTLRELATKLGLHGAGLGAAFLAPAVVIAASGAAIAWAIAFDRRARTNASVLEYAAKLKWTPEQTRDVLDAMRTESALPNPKELAEFIGTAATGLVVGTVLILLLPTILRAAKRRSGRSRR